MVHVSLFNLVKNGCFAFTKILLYDRPASAPSRRRCQDKVTHGLVALSRMAGESYSSPAELRIMKWVVLRETYLNKLRGVVAASGKRAKSAARKGRTDEGREWGVEETVWFVG